MPRIHTITLADQEAAGLLEPKKHVTLKRSIHATGTFKVNVQTGQVVDVESDPSIQELMGVHNRPAVKRSHGKRQPKVTGVLR